MPDVATRTRARVERPPRWPAAIGAGAVLVLAVGLGVLAVLRRIELDEWWAGALRDDRAPSLEAAARVLDFLGGGWFGVFVVPVGVAVAFLVARRPWAASAFILGSAVSSGMVQLLKALFSRQRPDWVLLPLESGSFPSGHVANAATVVVLLALLLRRRWIAVAGAGYVVLMALSRTYLGAHWLTDTVGGALIGVAMAVLTWVLFAPRLRAERERVRA